MEVESIGVVGAGTMGHGIAQVAAVAGYPTVVCDVSRGLVNAALERIRANLDKGVERDKITSEAAADAVNRLQACTDIATAAAADLVIEAVPERLDLKKEILGSLDAAAGPDAVLASNTSSLSIAELAAAVSRPSRVLGMHFFNPVHVMKLVEVVLHNGTSTRARDAATAVAKRMGKTPIVVRDSPGFATSRLGVLLGLEAMRMVDEGVASAVDIDTAMKLGYRHPMGPLELTDLVGLDVRLDIAEYLYRALGSEAFRPPEILRRMVQEGKLGKKSGEGFYPW